MSRVPLPAAPALERLRVWIAIGLLALVAGACYFNSLGAPFFFDDDASIKDNPTIRRLADLGTVLSPRRDEGTGVAGRPIVNLSLAVNYAISGTAVRGYHATNALLHALAALTLFGLVRRALLLPALQARFGGAALPLAFTVAVWWAAHPLQTESVTCVIQRTEVLVGLFYLLTLYAVCRSLDSPARRWPALAIGACLIGMASKEVMVSAPLLALLFDRTFGAGTFRAAWAQRRPLYLGLAGTWLLLAWLVLSGGGTRGTAAGFGLGVTWWSYAFKQCDAIVTYLKLTVWPHPLVVFYGSDVVTDFTAVLPQFAVLAAAAAGTFYALARRSALGFIGLWFFALLAPSSSVVPLVTQTMAEHRMYLPLAAPLVLIVVGGHALGRRGATAALLAVAAACGVLTIRRNHDYRSQLAIWSDTVAKRPATAGAHLNLGAALRAAGQRDAAMQAYREALRLSPYLAEAHNNVATLLLEAGRPAEAIPYCETALRLKAKFAAAHNNLGSALTQVGRLAEGQAQIERALALNPELAPAHSNLAGTLLQSGQPAASLDHALTALRFDPQLPDAHTNDVHALFALGRPGEAVAHFEAVLRLNPADVMAWSNLGAVLYQLQRPQDAVEPLRTALRLRPDFVDAHNNLGSALLQLGQLAEGAEHFRAALRLRPENADAHCNLGIALARLDRETEAVVEFRAALALNPHHALAQTYLANVTAQLEKRPK